MCVCERERERERIFRARQRVSFRAHTHTHNVPHEEKKSARSKKEKSPPPPGVSIPTFAPTGKVARIFPSRSFSLALDGGKRIDRRSRRARAAKWDIGSLGSRTPPVVRRDDPQNRSREMGGGARSFKPNTPNASKSKAKGFVFRRRTREKARDDDDDDDDAPSSCTRSTDSPRFFCGLWIVQVAFDLRSRSSPPRDVFLVLLVVGG